MRHSTWLTAHQETATTQKASIMTANHSHQRIAHLLVLMPELNQGKLAGNICLEGAGSNACRQVQHKKLNNSRNMQDIVSE
jgi:hypothetical protein